MDFAHTANGTGTPGNDTSQPGEDLSDLLTSKRDLKTQATISVVLGVVAFAAFCILRPRWTGLYAARKQQKNEASQLPQLPNTLLGWIPVVYKIGDDDVLASAGLDAFVFLAFFKMAIKYLCFLLFFSLTVIYPIHKTIGGEAEEPDEGESASTRTFLRARAENSDDGGYPFEFSNDYLWIYVVFVYVYSLAAMYLIFTETNKVIRVRQKYLSVQSSVTDRTIRLSGIPVELCDENKLKEMIESLEIGKVDSVTLCRNWQRLDDLVDERTTVLRKLERAWTEHLGSQGAASKRSQHRAVMHETGNQESEALLENGELGHDNNEPSHVTSVDKPKPTTRLWFGFLNLQSRKVDAIDYYEERLRRLDERIKAAREAEYPPMTMAFVTLDSIAACQMAIQAIIDPKPMQLMVNSSPPPADVVWRNTYLPRHQRMLRSWSITFLVLVLTVFWFTLLTPFAALINLNNLYKLFPPLEDFLSDHENIRSLVRTGLPTLAITILNLLVPYIYDYLSNLQGMTSQGDVELSVISKNFFFTFFVFFIAFTLIGTAATTFGLDGLREKLKERLGNVLGTTQVIATALQGLGPLYMNLIVLQAFGVFPLRLLEFGSVFLYPFGLLSAKTPRDYADLVQPPVFSYGFFLPQTIFIFDICIIYSILPQSELLVLFGLVYFLMGSFIYKYQLLYAMDHRNASTGRAWPMICQRVVVGLAFFQIAMGGQLFLKDARWRAVLVVPLFVATIWFGTAYRRAFEPLTKFIALRSLHENHDEAMSVSETRREEQSVQTQRRSDEAFHAKFVNPNLFAPLEDVWISTPQAREASQETDSSH